VARLFARLEKAIIGVNVGVQMLWVIISSILPVVPESLMMRRADTKNLPYTWSPLERTVRRTVVARWSETDTGASEPGKLLAKLIRCYRLQES
jgi:hypothetical protein